MGNRHLFLADARNVYKIKQKQKQKNGTNPGSPPKILLYPAKVQKLIDRKCIKMQNYMLLFPLRKLKSES